MGIKRFAKIIRRKNEIAKYSSLVYRIRICPRYTTQHTGYINPRFIINPSSFTQFDTQTTFSIFNKSLNHIAIVFQHVSYVFVFIIDFVIWAKMELVTFILFLISECNWFGQVSFVIEAGLSFAQEILSACLILLGEHNT